ncbi:hypothetical protein KCU73_g30, partial [Aureobasidium melanogenum]
MKKENPVKNRQAAMYGNVVSRSQRRPFVSMVRIPGMAKSLHKMFNSWYVCLSRLSLSKASVTEDSRAAYIDSAKLLHKHDKECRLCSTTISRHREQLGCSSPSSLWFEFILKHQTDVDIVEIASCVQRGLSGAKKVIQQTMIGLCNAPLIRGGEHSAAYAGVVEDLAPIAKPPTNREAKSCHLPKVAPCQAPEATETKHEIQIVPRRPKYLLRTGDVQQPMATEHSSIDCGLVHALNDCSSATEHFRWSANDAV